MTKQFIALLFFIIPFINYGQSSFPNTMKYHEELGNVKGEIEDLAWIAGNWRGKGFGGIVEELWSKPVGNSMMATFRLVVDGEVKFYEIETITEENETLFLRLKHFNADLKGWEEKDEVVEFRLVKLEENRVFFDGFTIEKISDEELHFYVVIDDEGDAREMKFVYRKFEE